MPKPKTWSQKDIDKARRELALSAAQINRDDPEPDDEEGEAE